MRRSRVRSARLAEVELIAWSRYRSLGDRLTGSRPDLVRKPVASGRYQRAIVTATTQAEYRRGRTWGYTQQRCTFFGGTQAYAAVQAQLPNALPALFVLHFSSRSLQRLLQQMRRHRFRETARSPS